MIDVIIPCRNAPQALWLTLTHFWANAYNPAHVASVILIDNCSTDAQVGVVLDYVQRHHPRTVVILNEQNVGVWCSINRGLAASRSEFAFVLTSDVLLARDTLPILADAITRESIPLLGPEVKTGLGECPALARAGGPYHVDCSTYNGACWMMDWKYLRSVVGAYDPRFYVAYGDTDYIEQLREKRVNGGTHAYGVLRGLPCVHLDKQSRRADGTAMQDSQIELKDAQEFARKWAAHPDVVRRHTPGLIEQMVAWKEQNLGGWAAARIQ